jgi:hypothetical protein
MGTFDRAEWHREISSEQAVTHIAMFLGWAITRGLIAPAHREDPSAAWYIERIEAREKTARDFTVDLCRSRLREDDLGPEGCAFAASYYSRYLSDYARTFHEALSIYEVEDTLENFDRIARILDRRLAAWRRWREKHGDRLGLDGRPE